MLIELINYINIRFILKYIGRQTLWPRRFFLLSLRTSQIHEPWRSQP
ncbi:MAG: hypothetical protein KatS3mg110_3509 [Pirellulaceae bacterium]|nr:MAG: hypothetical protein KatS3mg110_3509 [Pirellulaceae bacterium]